MYVVVVFSDRAAAMGAALPDSQDSVISGDKPGVLIAQKKKRKKKKKKRKKGGEEDAGTEAAAEGEAAAAEGGTGAAGGSVHGAQESPGKYSWQVSLLSDFRQVSSQVGESKSGSGKYDLDALGLYVIGDSLEVGGGLTYAETTTKYEESTSKSSSVLIKLKGVYNFGNIHTDTSVFFAGLGLGFGSSSSKDGDADEVKSSVTQFGLGLGMHWFVDSNVAFTGEFSYDTGSSKADGAEEATKFTEIHFIKLGFSLFI
jgi:hypothetical protein